jgi:hypothetical protein
MQLRNSVFLILGMFLATNLKSQVNSKEYLQLYLKEFNVYITPNSCSGAMNVELSNGQGVLKVNLVDCKGKLIFKHYNSSGKLVVEGAYASSLDTLKRYTTGKSAIDGSRRISVYSYFQPLPDGVWKYSGNKKVVYNKGIKG